MPCDDLEGGRGGIGGIGEGTREAQGSRGGKCIFMADFISLEGRNRHNNCKPITLKLKRKKEGRKRLDIY